MKKLLILSLLAVPFFASAALVPTSIYRDTVGGFIRPIISTDTFRLPSLTGCDTIDTDGDGDFVCGTDGGGGGGIAWPFTKQADNSQGTTTVMSFLGGFYSSASSTLTDFRATNGTTTNATSTNFFSSVASSTNFYGGSFTAGGSNKFGFNGTSAGLSYSVGFGTQVLAPDGGAYLMVRNGEVAYNSAKHTYANGGNAMWTWNLPTVSGKMSFTNGAATAGAGFDVTTDGTLKIRNTAQDAYADLMAKRIDADTLLVAQSGVYPQGVARATLTSPADSQFNFVDSTGVGNGIGLDFATDGTLKIRNRAQNADANITAGSATTTQATTTSLHVSGLASTTNLRSNAAVIGTLTTGNLLANGSSTLQNFTATNATTTAATTTDLHVSGLASTTAIRANTGIIGMLTAVTASITNLIFDGETFDSLTDDATLANNAGDLQVVDLTCTNCIDDTEITTNAGTALSADLEEEVTEGSLADSVIVEADLKVVNAPGDEEFFTFEATTGDFEWHTCTEMLGAGLCDGNDASGAGGASFEWPFTLQATGAQSTSTLMEFSAGFNSSASSTVGANTTASGLTIFGGSTTTGQTLKLGSTTLQSFTATHSTTTQATTTNLYSALGSFLSFLFDGEVFDSLTDDATLDNNGGDLRVVDVTCTNCLTTTEVASADLATLATNVSDADFGEITVGTGAWTIDDGIIESEHFGDDDWGEGTIASNVFTVDDNVIESEHLGDDDWGDITITTNAAAVEDDSHAHTGVTLSGIDVSDDLNLTAGDNLTLTADDLDLDTTLTSMVAATFSGLVTSGNFLSMGSSTWQSFTATNGTTTNATTTNFSISNLFGLDGFNFDSLTDDATLDHVAGDLRVVDLTCTNCIDDTEITTNAGTALSADLEEEVTEGSLADSVIVTADIKDGEILEADLNAANAPGEEEFLTSEGTGFEWHTCTEQLGAGLCDGTDDTGGGGFPWPWTKQADGYHATSTGLLYSGGFISTASTTLPNALFTLFSGVGLGTTTPAWPLTIASSTRPQLNLQYGAGTPGWAFMNTGLGLEIGSTTLGTYATNTPSALSLFNTGEPALSIGSSTGASILPLARFNLASNGTQYQSAFRIGSSATSSMLITNNGVLGFASNTPIAQFSIHTASSSSTVNPAPWVMAIGSSSPLASTGLQNAPPTLLAIDSSGRRFASSTRPTLSSCGTSPTIVGTDTAGRVTIGTGTTGSCLLTFSRTWGNAPFCTVTNAGYASAVPAWVSLIASTSATTMGVGGVSTTTAPSTMSIPGVRFHYKCEGNLE